MELRAWAPARTYRPRGLAPACMTPSRSEDEDVPNVRGIWTAVNLTVVPPGVRCRSEVQSDQVVVCHPVRQQCPDHEAAQGQLHQRPEGLIRDVYEVDDRRRDHDK